MLEFKKKILSFASLTCFYTGANPEIKKRGLNEKVYDYQSLLNVYKQYNIICSKYGIVPLTLYFS